MAVVGQDGSPASTAAAVGGGDEFALACDQLVLIDDESRQVSRLRVPCGSEVLTRIVGNAGARKGRADRFLGPKTVETKVFGRLTAWQNWIFTRPNASGPDGALRRFAAGRKGDYDFRRI